MVGFRVYRISLLHAELGLETGEPGYDKAMDPPL